MIEGRQGEDLLESSRSGFKASEDEELNESVGRTEVRPPTATTLYTGKLRAGVSEEEPMRKLEKKWCDCPGYAE